MFEERNERLILPVSTAPSYAKRAQVEFLRCVPGTTNDERREHAKAFAKFLMQNVSWVFLGALIAEVQRQSPTIVQDVEALLNREKPRAKAFRRLKDATDEQISEVLSLLDEER